MRGGGEGGFDRLPVAGQPFEAQIARNARRQLRCTGGARGRSDRHRRQRRVIDRNPLGGVQRQVAGLGDDQRHRLADIADRALGQQRLRREGERLAGLTTLASGDGHSGFSPSARASTAVSTASTPGKARAALVSMRSIRAWAWGERSTTACITPSKTRSSR